MVELVVAAALVRLRTHSPGLLANLHIVIWFTLCGAAAPMVSGLLGAPIAWLLVEIARRLASRLRDLIGRPGGDEFAVVLDGAREDRARLIADDYGQLIGASKIRLRDDVMQYASISCGVAFAQPGDTCQTLMERADDALYAAKRKRENDGHVRLLQG